MDIALSELGIPCMYGRKGRRKGRRKEGGRRRGGNYQKWTTLCRNLAFLVCEEREEEEERGVG
jgi:hypothetical protein